MGIIWNNIDLGSLESGQPMTSSSSPNILSGEAGKESVLSGIVAYILTLIFYNYLDSFYLILHKI